MTARRHPEIYDKVIHWRRALYAACSDEILEARVLDSKGQHAARMRVRRMMTAVTPSRGKKLPRTLRRRIEDHLR